MTTVPKEPRRPKRANGEGSYQELPDDKGWIFSITYQGKVIRRQGPTKRAAKAKFTNWLRLREAGIPATSDSWTLHDWLDHWLEDTIKPRVDENGEQYRGREWPTYENYERNVRRHIKPYFRNRPLIELQPEHVEDWLRRMSDDGVSRENQRSALVRLNTALELATRRGHMLRNVAQYVERPQPPKAQHVQPSELDLQRVLRATAGHRFEILAWLGLGAGLRRQELTGLQWEDIERLAPDHAVLNVQRRVNYGGKGVRRLERDGTKNGDPLRRVHLRGLAVEVLERRWKHQLADRVAASKAWRGEDYQADRPSGYILTNPSDGLPMNVRSVDRYFAEIRDRAGLDQKRLHGLRRIFTTLLDRGGVSERVTMKAAGHKTPAMTRYYQDPMDSQLADAAGRLDAQLRELVEAH